MINYTFIKTRSSFIHEVLPTYVNLYCLADCYMPKKTEFLPEAALASRYM